MIEKTDFEPFLFISKSKYQIIVFDNKKLENLYNKELEIYDEFDFKNLIKLSEFLDDNIYKIEKLIGNFIKNIILIIDSEKNLNVNISIKKKKL